MKPRIPTAKEVKAQGHIKLQFDEPLDPGDKKLPWITCQEHFTRKASKEATENQSTKYFRTLIEGGLIDGHSECHSPSRAHLVNVDIHY